MGSVYADLRAYSEVMTTSSNLGSFLGSITPIVRTHTIGKSCRSCEHTSNRVGCYNLADLWNQFYEWSACGVGTPVRFPSGENIDQYFVPYLSALQLYTKADCASQSCRKSSVEENCNDQTTSPTWTRGQLCFEYFELDSHDERMPLADKVFELSYNFPVLASLHGAELSPSSWMSVFWYPICHVPEQNLNDLTTCFLTYHGLATPEDGVPLDTEHGIHRYAALTPFGLSMHMMESVWSSADSGDEELAASLFGSAQSWLKNNDIEHHDFNNLPNIVNLSGDE